MNRNLQVALILGATTLTTRAYAQPTAKPPAATEDHDASTAAAPELPWFDAPAFSEAPPEEEARPSSLSLAFDYYSIDGDLLGTVISASGVVGIGNGSLSFGIGSADLTFHDADHPTDVVASTQLYSVGAGYGVNAGKQLYENDGTHVYILTPAAHAMVSTDGNVILGTLRVRIVGARVQWCPGVFIDVEPVWSAWTGSVDDPTMPSTATAMSKRFSSSGTSLGASAAIGWKWD